MRSLGRLFTTAFACCLVTLGSMARADEVYDIWQDLFLFTKFSKFAFEIDKNDDVFFRPAFALREFQTTFPGFPDPRAFNRLRNGEFLLQVRSDVSGGSVQFRFVDKLSEAPGFQSTKYYNEISSKVSLARLDGFCVQAKGDSKERIKRKYMASAPDNWFEFNGETRDVTYDYTSEEIQICEDGERIVDFNAYFIFYHQMIIHYPHYYMDHNVQLEQVRIYYGMVCRDASNHNQCEVQDFAARGETVGCEFRGQPSLCSFHPGLLDIEWDKN